MAKANYYNAIASIYDQTRWMTPDVAEEIADRILALVNATPNTSFLEPGIGTGLNMLPLVKRGYPVTGMDISAEMLAQLKQKLQPIPPNLTLIQADASSLPLPDDSFDVVLTVHMIHTVSDWQIFLDEVGRVLKPQGFYLNAQWTTPPARKVFETHFKAILLKYKEIAIPKYLDNLVDAIAGLINAGAADILVANLPTLGNQPLAKSLDNINPQTSAGLSALSTQHNFLLANKLNTLKANSAANIIPLDIGGLIDDAVDSPKSFGFANVTESCLSDFVSILDFGTPCENPDEFLFWDDVHPTAQAHSLVAQFAFDTLADSKPGNPPKDPQSVPEPASAVALIFIGSGLLLQRKRRFS